MVLDLVGANPTYPTNTYKSLVVGLSLTCNTTVNHSINNTRFNTHNTGSVYCREILQKQLFNKQYTMSPTMQKILELGYIRIRDIDDDVFNTDTIRKVLSDCMLEYAMSIVPEEKQSYGQDCFSWNECRDEMLETIQQDSLDLPTN